ncbi:MAG: hypothetical protein R3C10_18190 [Pirellulales bacterium]|nr:hypothetical protein [Planctomycetales bacterium]
MLNNEWHVQLHEHLRAQGHTEEEIAKIFSRVNQYDVETKHDSVMDAIDAGQIDLAKLITEALGERD